MAALGVPGVGYALIDHGKIAYEGGFGVRELGKPEPVDAHTRFLIASNTKGMTTLLLAELVDQHKLSWNEPVTQAFPAFRLGRAEITRQVLIKHLVCACTGLPRQDMEWLFNTNAQTPPARTFATLATMQPTSPFGETYQYSNLMAAAAGYVAGHVVHPDMDLGAAYDEAMQSMVFNPLAMRDTTFDFARALTSDHASPHDWDMDGHLSVARLGANTTIIPFRPAGGAWSSAHDMILYVQNELAEGRLADGKQLVSKANLLFRRAPGVAIGEDQSYGMGLENDSRSGVNIVHHGGALFGYLSDFMAVPSAQVGAVVLTNSEAGGRLVRAFRRRLLEVLYDGKPEAQAEIAAVAISLRAARVAERRTLSIPPDPTLTADLAAHYTNGALGHIHVKREAGALIFDFGAWHSRMATRRSQDGTVSFVTIDPTDKGLEFIRTKAPLEPGLILRDGQHEYRYAVSK
jgi:CubicO group peptidase (beta-lactamase class C family)